MLRQPRCKFICRNLYRSGNSVRSASFGFTATTFASCLLNKPFLFIWISKRRLTNSEINLDITLGVINACTLIECEPMHV